MGSWSGSSRRAWMRRPDPGSGRCRGDTACSGSSSARTARSGSRIWRSIPGATDFRPITRRCTASSAFRSRSRADPSATSTSPTRRAPTSSPRMTRRSSRRSPSTPGSRSRTPGSTSRSSGSRSFDERERISKDLHDGIIQNLYAVGLSLEDVPELVRSDPDEVERRVERAIDSLHLTIRDIRNFIFGLRPELLSGTTLISGLVAIVEEFRHNSMIDVELHVGDMETEPDDDDHGAPARRRQRVAEQRRASLRRDPRHGLRRVQPRGRTEAGRRGQWPRLRSDDAR